MKAAKLLKSARKAAGLTQSEVARFMGYKSPMFVSLMERGKSSIPRRHIDDVAKAYRVDKKELLEAMIYDIGTKIKKGLK